MGVPRTSDRGSKAVIQIQYRKFASNIGTPRSVYHRAISNGTTPKTLDSTYLQRKTSIPARIWASIQPDGNRPRVSNFQPNPTPVVDAAAPCKLSSAHVVPAHSAAEAAVTTHPTKHSQHPRPPKPQWLFILAVSTRVLEPKIPTTRKTAKHPP